MHTRDTRTQGMQAGTRTLAQLAACALALLLPAQLSPRTYTNADVDVLKDEYGQRVHHARRGGRAPRVSEARFPLDVMSEATPSPTIVQRLLPYWEWEREYEAYFVRHTGSPRLDLTPTILVMHYTAGDTFASAYNIFKRGVQMSAGDSGTVFGHPSVHYMIDTDGQIYQLLPNNRRGTGTYGVNHCALQVEMVAPNEAELVNNAAILRSSFRLARMLVRAYGIPQSKVYGHYDVSDGRVPEFLDYADLRYPNGYPPSSARTDPGTTYMSWLRYYLRYKP